MKHINFEITSVVTFIEAATKLMEVYMKHESTRLETDMLTTDFKALSKEDRLHRHILIIKDSINLIKDDIESLVQVLRYNTSNYDEALKEVRTALIKEYLTNREGVFIIATRDLLNNHSLALATKKVNILGNTAGSFVMYIHGLMNIIGDCDNQGLNNSITRTMDISSILNSTNFN